MSRSDDRREHKLPLTGEVGGEGGSSADPTMQVPTFENDLQRTDEATTDSPLDAEREPTPRLRRNVNK
jgi:hypothetical protein